MRRSLGAPWWRIKRLSWIARTAFSAGSELGSKRALGGRMRIQILAVVALLAACGGPQKPAVFVTSATLDTGIDTVSRTLAADGQGMPTVDRKAGIVTTAWKDSGFLYGQVQGTNATILRRFTVVLAPAESGSNVTVRIDAKRCAQGGFSIDGSDVRGPCEEISVIPGSFQEDIDALGAKLRAALASK
jgi:hypothetical protein